MRDIDQEKLETAEDRVIRSLHVLNAVTQAVEVHGIEIPGAVSAAHLELHRAMSEWLNILKL